ncbi:translation initiation factor 2 [Lysinibacillus sp. NPDC096418]|uniref:translation initiation factor 2 n=1 Tax=Lysinibacillus sp. NPDC096418 TaxID=3364138 RepID=UPI0038143169
MNDSKKNSNQSADLQDIYIARLAFIGTSISTLGDGIQMVAAGLALEALEKSNNQSAQNSNGQSKQTENMEKQIDYLINELKQIKRVMK